MLEVHCDFALSASHAGSSTAVLGQLDAGLLPEPELEQLGVEGLLARASGRSSGCRRWTIWRGCRWPSCRSAPCGQASWTVAPPMVISPSTVNTVVGVMMPLLQRGRHGDDLVHRAGLERPEQRPVAELARRSCPARVRGHGIDLAVPGPHDQHVTALGALPGDGVRQQLLGGVLQVGVQRQLDAGAVLRPASRRGRSLARRGPSESTSTVREPSCPGQPWRRSGSRYRRGRGCPSRSAR